MLTKPNIDYLSTDLITVGWTTKVTKCEFRDLSRWQQTGTAPDFKTHLQTMV